MPIEPPKAETSISIDLVRALLQEQLPEFAEEELTWVAGGWDNELFRLGTTHAVRLPRRSLSAPLIANEHASLPQFEAQIALQIPTPIHVGRPALGYPWPWSVVAWIEGIPLAHAPRGNRDQLIGDLAEFGNSLHVSAPEDAPKNEFRGVDLALKQPGVEKNLSLCPDLDTETVRALWDELVETPEWGGEPVWLHGDLHPLNMLVRGGRLSGIIDFGDVTAGDPATDLSVAWMLFDKDERDKFRSASTIDGRTVDIHTWNRSRAWALSMGVAYLAHSETAPTMRRIGMTTLERVLA